jgi:hypothetical protein
LKRRRIVDVVLVPTGAVVLAAGIGFWVADFHVQTLLSGSMRPTVSPGDLLRNAGLIVAGLCVAVLILLEIRKGVGARRAQAIS